MIHGVSSATSYFQLHPQAQGPSSRAEDSAASEQALKAVKADTASNAQQPAPENTVTPKDEASKVKDELKQEAAQQKSASGEPLTEDQVREVEQLKQRDMEVRAHEAAHLAAAGQHARGGMSFSYKNGPDGKRYAVGGEVSVDTSPIPGDPQATLQKANTIRAAAMAPAEPSAQDRAVAAQATQMAAQARQDIAQNQAEALSQSREKMNEKTDVSVEKIEDDNDGTHTGKQAAASYQQVEGITRESPSSLKLDLMI